MKIFILITLFYSLLFSDCSTSLKVLVSDDRTGSTVPSGSAQAAAYPRWACTSEHASYYYLSGGYQYFTTYYEYLHIRKFKIVTTCPVDTIPNENKECVPPVACTWAVPPWRALPLAGYNSVSCTPLNINGLYNSSSMPYYVTAASFCTTNLTCYFKNTTCPVGQVYNNPKMKCSYPVPDPTKCLSGYISRNYSLGIDEFKTCFTEKICKDNPTIRQTFEVSCGTAPDATTPITGANGPIAPTIVPDSSTPMSSPTNDTCISAQLNARSACIPPKVLTFSCNPLTGVILKSSCASPTTPTTTTVVSGDDTKSSTTEDIKNLSNNLPTSIRDALKDYFSDGSMSHLESIRGSLEASTILQSDTIDKLNSISASADASLVLQGDSNAKLDSLKNSVDGIGSTINGGSFTGDSLPTSAQLEPDSSLVSGFDTFTNSLTSVNKQFDQAKIIFHGGLPLPSFGGGSCPSYSFYGNTVSISKIGDSIAPYSSIMSILIYVLSIISSFRLVINFLIRGN